MKCERPFLTILSCRPNCFGEGGPSECIAPRSITWLAHSLVNRLTLYLLLPSNPYTATLFDVATNTFPIAIIGVTNLFPLPFG